VAPLGIKQYLTAVLPLLRAETDCQRKPTEPLGLSLSERCDLEHFGANHRGATQASRSNTGIFIKQKGD
jgi:hypothetical protein